MMTISEHKREARREYMRRYYRRNRKKMLAYQKEYRRLGKGRKG